MDSLLKKALIDPSAVYKHPEEVLTDNRLTKRNKMRVLKQWKYDAEELLTAEGENMQAHGRPSVRLSTILEAIRQLDPSFPDESKK